MANDYKPLNRNQLWNSPQKKAIKKAFTALETAAAAGDHDAAGATRKDVSRILDPYLDAQESHDIKRMFEGIREAIVAADASYDVVQHTTAFQMSSSKKKVLRVLAASTVAQIV